MLFVLAIAVVVVGGGKKPPKTTPDQAYTLKLQQAKGILDSGEKLEDAIALVDGVIASNASDKTKTDAKALKDKIQAKMREPKPLDKMTQPELLDAANALVSKGSVLESVRYYERLVSLDPAWTGGGTMPCGITYSTLMYQIGLIYDGAGQHDMAVQVWKREQTVLPDAPPANVPHGKIRERLRNAGSGA
ncbi:MAG: hypothetical protein U0166_21225 [Acidobacteriota bacterium]